MLNNYFTICLLVIVLMFLSCDNKNKNNFEVFGEESLLKDCKINVYKSGEDLQMTKTLLFNGNRYEVKSSETDIRHIIYVSYRDSLVNIIDYENILRGEENQINHFYLYKNKDIISFKFIGNEEFLKEKEESPGHILIPINEYLIQKHVDTEELKNKEKRLFFDFYGK